MRKYTEKDKRGIYNSLMENVIVPAVNKLLKESEEIEKNTEECVEEEDNSIQEDTFSDALNHFDKDKIATRAADIIKYVTWILNDDKIQIVAVVNTHGKQTTHYLIPSSAKTVLRAAFDKGLGATLLFDLDDCPNENKINSVDDLFSMNPFHESVIKDIDMNMLHAKMKKLIKVNYIKSSDRKIIQLDADPKQKADYKLILAYLYGVILDKYVKFS